MTNYKHYLEYDTFMIFHGAFCLMEKMPWYKHDKFVACFDDKEDAFRALNVYQQSEIGAPND